MTAGPLEITLAPPRVRVYRRRCHHGPAGIPMLFSRHRTVRLIGLALIVSDLHDGARWISDFVRHPDAR